jgi:hypothetical protein
MRALIARLAFDWTMWRLKRKLIRSSPIIRDLDAEERAARKAHRGVRAIAAERSRIVHQQLAREVGRTA